MDHLSLQGSIILWNVRSVDMSWTRFSKSAALRAPGHRGSGPQSRYGDARHVQPGSGEQATTSEFTLGLKSIIAIGGAVLLILGVFVPFFSAPVIPGMSLWQVGSFVQTIQDLASKIPLLAGNNSQLDQLNMARVFIQCSAYMLLVFAGFSIAAAFAKWPNWSG